MPNVYLFHLALRIRIKCSGIPRLVYDDDGYFGSFTHGSNGESTWEKFFFCHGCNLFELSEQPDILRKRSPSDGSQVHLVKMTAVDFNAQAVNWCSGNLTAKLKLVAYIRQRLEGVTRGRLECED